MKMKSSGPTVGRSKIRKLEKEKYIKLKSQKMRKTINENVVSMDVGPDDGLQGIPSSRLKLSIVWASNVWRARVMNSWMPMLA